MRARAKTLDPERVSRLGRCSDGRAAPARALAEELVVLLVDELGLKGADFFLEPERLGVKREGRFVVSATPVLSGRIHQHPRLGKQAVAVLENVTPGKHGGSIAHECRRASLRCGGRQAG